MKKYCRNCYHPLPYKAKFCAHCGQKDSDGRIGMKSLLGRLWNNTFHLEGKFIRTAWQLFIPGKVTQEFFKGKQDRYPHPIRLFAIVMFLFLFLVNSVLKNVESGGDGNILAYGVDTKTDTGRDTIVEEKGISTYEKMRYNAMMYEFQEDYEKMPEAWKNAQSHTMMDSMLALFAKRHSLENKRVLDSLLQGPIDSIGFGMGAKGVQIATLDIVRYSPEEIIRRYQITHWLQKLVVRQGIKSYKTPEAFLHAAIGSLTWAILALVGLMSFVLGLLYIRQNRYYVEHFIFLLHFHTGAMLLLLIVLFGETLGLWAEWAIGLAAFLPLPGMYWAMRRYYGQGRWKTIVKWVFYCFSYLFTFVFLFILGMVAVFALY